MAACGAALAVPFWVGRIVPLLDLPQHLAVVSVLRHHGDAAWGFARFFDTQWGELTPYWTFYLVTYVLSFAVSVETAARVYLSVYAFAFPFAGVALCRAFGRSPWLGLLAAPLAFGSNLYFGFVSYCSAGLLFLFLLAAFERQLAAPRPRRALLLAVGVAVLFFTHVQVLAFFVAAAALLAATRTDRPWSLRVARLIPLAPAVFLLLVPWTYLQFIAGREGKTGGYAFARVATMRAGFQPVGESVRELPDAIAGAYRDGSDTLLLIAWAILAAFAGRGATRERWRAWTPAALALLCYFTAPVWITGQWNIGPRFAWLAALLLLPAAAAEGRRARLVGALAALLGFITAANAAVHHAAFDRELGALDQALGAIPRGVRVAPLIFDSAGQVLTRWPYLHIGQYAMVRRGGMSAMNLGRVAAFPIHLRDARTLPHTDPFWPSAFRFETMGTMYDYFLIRSGGPRATRLFPPGSAEVVFEQGEWRVLRRR